MSSVTERFQCCTSNSRALTDDFSCRGDDSRTGALVVFVAGATNGLAGFGFAVVGTMALATIIDPTTAVVFMVIPILAVNISLVRNLSRHELRTCSRRFGPLIGAALVGTVAGMAVLDSIPAGPLRVGLGLLTLGFVATAQRRIPLPLESGW